MNWYRDALFREKLLLSQKMESRFSTYLDIGHGNTDKVIGWYYDEEKGDIIYFPGYKNHLSVYPVSKLFNLRRRHYDPLRGRIDKGQKKISLYIPLNESEKNIEYVRNVLRSDYPSFGIMEVRARDLG